MESWEPEQVSDDRKSLGNGSNYTYDEKVNGVEHFDQLRDLPQDIIVDQVAELQRLGVEGHDKVFIIRTAVSYQPLLHVLLRLKSTTFSATISALNLSCSQTLFSCNYAQSQKLVVTKCEGDNTEVVGSVSDGIDDVDGVRYMNVQDHSAYTNQGSKHEIEHVIDSVQGRNSSSSYVFSNSANLRQNVTFGAGLNAQTKALILAYAIKNNQQFTAQFGHQFPVLVYRLELLSSMAKWVPKSLRRVTPFDMPPVSNAEQSTKVDSDADFHAINSGQPKLIKQQRSFTTQQSLTRHHPISLKQTNRVYRSNVKTPPYSRKTPQFGIQKEKTPATNINSSAIALLTTFSIQKSAESRQHNSHYYIIIDDKTHKVLYTVECSKTLQQEQVIVWSMCVPETQVISAEYQKGSRQARIVVDHQEIGRIDFDGIYNIALNEMLRVTSYYVGDGDYQLFIIQRTRAKHLTSAVISFSPVKAKITVELNGDWNTEWRALLTMFALSTISTYHLHEEPVARVSSLLEVIQMAQEQAGSQFSEVINETADNEAVGESSDEEPTLNVQPKNIRSRSTMQSSNAQNNSDGIANESGLVTSFKQLIENQTTNMNDLLLSDAPTNRHSALKEPPSNYFRETLGEGVSSHVAEKQTTDPIFHTDLFTELKQTDAGLDAAEIQRRLDLFEHSLMLTFEDIAVHRNSDSTQITYGVVKNFQDGLPLVFTLTTSTGDMTVTDLNFSKVLFAADNCNDNKSTSTVYPTANWRNQHINEFGSVHKQWIRNLYGRKIMDVLATRNDFHLKGVGEECGDASISLLAGTNRIQIAQHKWLKKKHKYLVLCSAKKSFTFEERKLVPLDGNTRKLLEIASL